MIRITVSKWKWVPDVVTALLIFLFMYTAITKLINVEAFKITLSLSPYLKNNASLLSWAIPIGELIICSLLFIPRYRKIGFMCASILMAVFSIYVGFMILFSKGLPCSCGGIIEKMSWPQHLVFNITFFFLSVIAWKLKQNLNKEFIAINR